VKINKYGKITKKEQQIPVEARFLAPYQIGPGAHSTACTMKTGFLSRG
jgi:hypothetical protein